MRARYRIYEVSQGRERPRIAQESLRVWDPDAGRFTEDAAPGRAAR
jgi:hypothetical protein